MYGNESFFIKLFIVSIGDCGHIKDVAVCFTRYEWELCKLDRYQVTTDYFVVVAPMDLQQAIDIFQWLPLEIQAEKLNDKQALLQCSQLLF